MNQLEPSGLRPGDWVVYCILSNWYGRITKVDHEFIYLIPRNLDAPASVGTETRFPHYIFKDYLYDARYLRLTEEDKLSYVEELLTS